MCGRRRGHERGHERAEPAMASIESIESFDSSDSSDLNDSIESFDSIESGDLSERVCDGCGCGNVIFQRGVSGGLCRVCASCFSPGPDLGPGARAASCVFPVRVLVPDSEDDYVSETDFESDASSEASSEASSDASSEPDSLAMASGVVGSGTSPLLFRCSGLGSV